MSSLSDIFGKGPNPRPTEFDENGQWHPIPGATVHVLASGLMFHGERSTLTYTDGRVLSRGEEIVLTPKLMELNSALKLAGDPEAQLERWGKVMLGPGHFPDSEPRYVKGTLEAELEGQRLRALAHKIPDEDDRARELARITRLYGRPSNKQTLAHYAGDDAR